MAGVYLTKVGRDGRVGIARAGGMGAHVSWLSPGITDPLPGWEWLTGREHPEVELSFEIIRDGARFSASLKPGARPGLAAELARAARG